jgi:hypothetical protein
MKRIVSLLLLVFCFVFSWRPAVAEGGSDALENILVANASRRLDQMVAQNHLNDSLGVSEQNRYVLYVDPVQAMREQVPYLYMRAGNGEAQYLTEAQRVVLDAQLAAIHKQTGLQPYMLIINNIPVILPRALRSDESFKAIMEAKTVDEDALDDAKTKALDQFNDICAKVKASIEAKKKITKGVIVCWARYVKVLNHQKLQGACELQNEIYCGLDPAIGTLIKAQIGSIKTDDRNERATEFVKIIGTAATQYNNIKIPTADPGKTFYEQYASLTDDKYLLMLIANRINDLGSDVYEQYKKDAEVELSGFLTANLEAFYESLGRCQDHYQQWLKDVGNIKDPGMLSLSYLNAKEKPAWWAALSLDKRVKALQDLNGADLTSITNFFAEIAELKSYGGEEFVLDMIGNTPADQQSGLLDALLQQKLLANLMDHLNGDNFVTFVGYVTTFLNTVHPPTDADASVPNMVQQGRYLKFDGTFMGPSLAFDFSGKELDSIHLSETRVYQNFVISEGNVNIRAYDYLLVDFKYDFSIGGSVAFKKGTQLRLPAIFCYYLFNESRNQALMKSGKLAIDIASLAIGVGELNAAIEAANGLKIALAAADLGMSLGSSAVDAFSEYMSPAFLRGWAVVNKYYTLGRVTVDIVKMAVPLEQPLEDLKNSAQYVTMPAGQKNAIQSALNIVKQVLNVQGKESTIETTVAALSDLEARLGDYPNLVTWLQEDGVPGLAVQTVNSWYATGMTTQLKALNDKLGNGDGLKDDIKDVKLFTAVIITILNPYDMRTAIVEAGDDITAAVQASIKKDFFKNLMWQGKEFEAAVEIDLTSPTGVLNGKLNKLGVTLSNYEIFEQMQLKTGNTATDPVDKTKTWPEYFVADFVLIPRQAGSSTPPKLDVQNAIVLECKLSEGTDLTDRQKAGLNIVRAGRTMTVRSSQSASIVPNSQVLGPTGTVKVVRFIKVYDNGTATGGSSPDCESIYP